VPADDAWGSELEWDVSCCGFLVIFIICFIATGLLIWFFGGMK
jgi:hypothetical protein